MSEPLNSSTDGFPSVIENSVSSTKSFVCYILSQKNIILHICQLVYLLFGSKYNL